MPFLRRSTESSSRSGGETLDLYYEIRGDEGDGRPRLLLFNGSGSTIEAAGPLIDQIARFCTVLVHDQRCLGKSGVPQAQPTMADYAADGAALLDEVGWDTACVFGMSFGGMVAQEFAVTYPERVERLVLFCTSPGGEGGSSYPLHELASLPPAQRIAIGMLNLDSRFTREWLDSHPADKAIAKMMGERASIEKSAETRRGEAMQLEARRHHDVWDRLDRIAAPTLISCGKYDGTAPPANSAAIASRIAGSVLREYEGGHLFPVQDPQAMRDMAAFVTGGSAPTG